MSSLRNAQIAHERRIQIEKECEEAIRNIRQYRAEMNAYIEKYLAHYQQVFDEAFSLMDEAATNKDTDQFIAGANLITKEFGGKVQFSNTQEFRDFMNSDNDFIL